MSEKNIFKKRRKGQKNGKIHRGRGHKKKNEIIVTLHAKKRFFQRFPEIALPNRYQLKLTTIYAKDICYYKITKNDGTRESIIIKELTISKISVFAIIMVLNNGRNHTSMIIKTFYNSDMIEKFLNGRGRHDGVISDLFFFSNKKLQRVG